MLINIRILLQKVSHHTICSIITRISSSWWFSSPLINCPWNSTPVGQQLICHFLALLSSPYSGFLRLPFLLCDFSSPKSLIRWGLFFREFPQNCLNKKYSLASRTFPMFIPSFFHQFQSLLMLLAYATPAKSQASTIVYWFLLSLDFQGC